MMTVEELRRVLEESRVWQRLFENPVAKSQLGSLSQLLTEYGHLSISEFCEKAREGLKKKAKAKKSALSELTSNPSITVRYFEELDQTRTDSRQFETIIARMKKDKNVRVAEARDIATRFVGGTRNFKTKADAVKAILQRQISDIRAADKLGRIADIF